ncbi:hypothetical protein L598_006100000150 [Mesorhizobium sp. J18]|uniref:hypothetical protein n=1 Tax=Mesorhizobium sp. J18 TaxID=935263 RepID=UPI00119C585C|nr:hypothetical protein [Mesorhizobium sp. J18]TWG91040.1 hypothetical protein L598_006100000150 [Mesorhizobium sp. J18]
MRFADPNRNPWEMFLCSGYLLHALSRYGYDITFFEPNVYERQENRDIDPPDWYSMQPIPEPSRNRSS